MTLSPREERDVTTLTGSSTVEFDVTTLGTAPPPPPVDNYVFSQAGLDLWRSLGPWYRADLENPAHPLRDFCEALVMALQPIDDIVRDGEYPGWSTVLNPDVAGEEWLPWLKQFAGMAEFETDTVPADDLRELIKASPVQKRGTVDSIQQAPKPFLTGTKTVFLIERHGDPYRATVAVRNSEVLDFDQVVRKVMAVKPAGIVLSVVRLTGNDYATLLSTHATYATLMSVYSSYSEILLDPAKQ